MQLWKAFLHFKDPERLPDSLSEILKPIINLFLHSCGCETSAEAPGEARARGAKSVGGLVVLTFIGRANVQAVEGSTKTEIYHSSFTHRAPFQRPLGFYS